MGRAARPACNKTGTNGGKRRSKRYNVAALLEEPTVTLDSWKAVPLSGVYKGGNRVLRVSGKATEPGKAGASGGPRPWSLERCWEIARCLGCSNGIYTALPYLQGEYETCQARWRHSLPQDELERLWNEGRAMTMGQAVALAQDAHYNIR